MNLLTDEDKDQLKSQFKPDLAHARARPTQSQNERQPQFSGGWEGCRNFAGPVYLSPALRLTLPTGFFRLKDSDDLQVPNYG
jgi:hypothetical protein